MSGPSSIPTVIERGLPSAVTYDLSTPGYVRITLPPSSTWSSGLHWHETHDEYLQVVKGSIRVRLGDERIILSAADGHQPEVKVPRFAWHEWQRAEPDGEDVVVVERTDPDEGDKALFFWNLNGVILSAPSLLRDPTTLISRSPAFLRGKLLDLYITLSLFVIFHSLDNFPVVIDVPSLVPTGARFRALGAADGIITHVLLSVSSALGWVIGLKPVRREFTPSDAYNDWWERRNASGGRKSR
jgi:hypothetical protein